MGRWSGRGQPPTRKKLNRWRVLRREEKAAYVREQLKLQKQWDRDVRRMKLEKMLTDGRRP